MVLGNWNIRQTTEEDPTFALCRYPRQTHSGTIVPGTACGQGVQEGDGVYMRIDETYACAIRTADCLPLALLADDLGILLHVSRKSVLQDLLEHADTVLGNRPIRYVYIGSHICSSCFTFEYDGSELSAFSQSYPFATTIEEGIRHVSLIQIVEHYLDAHNLAQSHIYTDGRCTVESGLTSYRRLASVEAIRGHHIVTILEPA